MTVSLKKNSAVLVDAVAEAKAVKAAIEQLQSELARLTEQIVVLNGGPDVRGKVALPNGDAFTVSEVNTYPDEAIRAMLSPGQQKRVEKRVIDKAKVRACYPEVYAAVKVQNGVKVTLA